MWPLERRSAESAARACSITPKKFNSMSLRVADRLVSSASERCVAPALSTSTSTRCAIPSTCATASLNPAAAAEEQPGPAHQATIANEDIKKAGADLYRLLLHITTGLALDKVINARELEGLDAWRALTARYETKIRQRAAGQLMNMLSCFLAARC